MMKPFTNEYHASRWIDKHLDLNATGVGIVVHLKLKEQAKLTRVLPAVDELQAREYHRSTDPRDATKPTLWVSVVGIYRRGE